MRHVVITGSTRGIGLAMAREFLQAGCQVTLSGRNPTLPDGLAGSLAAYAGQYCYVPCDVRDFADVEYLWQEAASRQGAVDFWINNAGVNCPYELCQETDPDFVAAVIDTNIKGMIYGSQVAAKNMLLQGSGQIFNMEGLGSNNMIQTKTILYGTTKRALTYFTRGLAKELAGTPVKAGRLSPGMMLTEFITRGPDGGASPVLSNKSFRFVFNALADRPETVARFLVPRMLANQRNDAHIIWLTNRKSAWRMMTAPLSKRRLLENSD